jgi:alpha/beta superfamily hydrolase
MPHVIFQGSAGRIEGRFCRSSIRNAPVAMILHPHPKHGGTMNNKVVYTLYQSFAKAGFSVLRFNFRGVGRSEGTYSEWDGELSDAASALDWLQATLSSNSFWIAGFSFGAWISMQLLMRRPEIEGFVAVSPPANLYDFSFLAPCPASGYIIQGKKDSIVDYTSVDTLVQRLVIQRHIKIDYSLIEEADHFFTNKQEILDEKVSLYLKKRYSNLNNIKTSQNTKILEVEHEKDPHEMIFQKFSR